MQRIRVYVNLKLPGYVLFVTNSNGWYMHLSEHFSNRLYTCGWWKIKKVDVTGKFRYLTTIYSYEEANNLHHQFPELFI